MEECRGCPEDRKRSIGVAPRSNMEQYVRDQEWLAVSPPSIKWKAQNCSHRMPTRRGNRAVDILWGSVDPRNERLLRLGLSALL